MQQEKGIFTNRYYIAILFKEHGMTYMYPFRLDEANAMVDKLQGKLAKSKKTIDCEQGNARDLHTALDAIRRDALESEAVMSLKIHNMDKQMQQLKSALQDKRVELDASRNDYDLKSSQIAAKCFEDVKRAREEASRWKSKYEDLDASTRSWKQFSESSLSHEKLTSSQLQETCAHLRKDNEEHSKVFTSDIAERNAMIDELNQIVQNITAELSHVRDEHVKELQHVTREKDNQMAEQEGEFQKEIGALQVGLCLQKEMKDRLQLSMNHLKTCLRSLALDLTRLGSIDGTATRSHYVQLCDLFDRLLVSGALVADGGDGGGEQSSQNWERHVSHMHSYINQHTELVTPHSHASSGAGTVSQYGQSLNIDSDFLSIVKSLKELLQHVLHYQSGPSLAARAEVTRLAEHTQLLRADLQESDMLLLSLVGQLMDEGFVDASELRDEYLIPGSVMDSFGDNTAGDNMTREEVRFYSGSKQRAVLHAKLCTGNIYILTNVYMLKISSLLNHTRKTSLSLMFSFLQAFPNP
jgi:hypothetical protein